MSINHLIFSETKPKYDIFVNNIECEDVKLQGSVEDLKFKAQNGDIIDLSSLPDHGLPSQRLTSNGNGEVSWVAGAGTSGIEYSGGEPVQLNKLAKYDATDGSLVDETSFIDTDIILKDGSVPMAGNLSMGGNNIFDVISVKTDSTTGNIRTNTINSGTTSGITFNSANNIVMNNTLDMAGNDIESVGNIEAVTLDGLQTISGTNTQDLLLNNNNGNNIQIPSCNLDMNNNSIENVFRLNVGRIKNPSLANIEIENDLFLRDNNITKVANINVDTFSVNSLPAILFNDDVSLFNNNIVRAGDIKTTSFSSTDGKTNDIDVNCNFDLNSNDITDVGDLQVSSINELTPVGGLYCGISDGVEINQASGVTDLLPVSSVGSLFIPAKKFKVGDAYHLVIAGIFPDEKKGEDVEIEIKQNGTVIGSVTLEYEDFDTVESNFELEADFVIRSIGVTGSLASNIDFTYNKKETKDFRGTRTTSTTTINTDTASSLTVTAKVTGANSSIQSTMAYLRKQY